MGIYFFYGDEDYLLEEELKKYRAKLDTNFSSMNYVVHDNPSYPDLIAALRTQPMMFGKLMIVIKCEKLLTSALEDFQTKEISEALLIYFLLLNTQETKERNQIQEKKYTKFYQNTMQKNFRQ